MFEVLEGVTEVEWKRGKLGQAEEDSAIRMAERGAQAYPHGRCGNYVMPQRLGLEVSLLASSERDYCLEELHRNLDDADLLRNRVVPVHPLLEGEWPLCDKIELLEAEVAKRQDGHEIRKDESRDGRLLLESLHVFQTRVRDTPAPKLYDRPRRKGSLHCAPRCPR